MNAVICPGERHGRVTVPSSKSQAHRLLICAALSAHETLLRCDGLSRDIEATMTCLQALGAGITVEGENRLRIRPIEKVPDGEVTLFCGESGSTLRFLLPLTGALGVSAVFVAEGALPNRPLAPLTEVLTAHGMRITSQGNRLFCSGRLSGGGYTMPGDISSQFISGLLMTLPYLAEDSVLRVLGTPVSADYIAMTENTLRLSGLTFRKNAYTYRIPGNQRGKLPERLTAERDWSSAAAFLCMGAASAKGVTVAEMDVASAQGDRRILSILTAFGAVVEQQNGQITVRRGRLLGQTIDAAQNPDLVPVLSALGAVSVGTTRIVNAGRLRFKESDRLHTTAELLKALGAAAFETADSLLIVGQPGLRGGTADAFGDHRIAMAAAVAAGRCEKAVTVIGAECAAKSYPRFWTDFEGLEVG